MLRYHLRVVIFVDQKCIYVKSLVWEEIFSGFITIRDSKNKVCRCLLELIHLIPGQSEFAPKKDILVNIIKESNVSCLFLRS